RDWHDHRPARRRHRRQPAAGDRARPQGLSGHGLRNRADLDPYLCAGRPFAAGLVEAKAGRRRQARTGEGKAVSRLRIENLTRRFDGLVAVDAVSFAVPAAGITAIIGPNGAGKTTLFNMIAGFLPPTAGRIFFDDEEVTGVVPERMAARGLVRTFQLVQLFQNLTVLENVKVGRHVRGRAGLFSALMRSPSARRGGGGAEPRARDRLHFVGAFADAATP